MERQLLDPIGELPAVAVVRRLGGVQAQVLSSAVLAVRVRQRRSTPGEVTGELAGGKLIKTWAMRGTLHLLDPESAGTFLSLLAAGRGWERPSWVRTFGLGPDAMERLRVAVREALDGAVLTREALGAEVVRRPGLGHVADALRSGWGSVLKPLAYQGDLCFGPSQGTRVTFARPEAISPAWQGVPAPDEAGPDAIARYLGAYGPATVEGFGNWLSRGRIPKRRLRGWFAQVGNRLVEVSIDGERGYVLAEHEDALRATEPSRGSARVRLLPGFDGWLLGPGTGDAHVLAPHRRRAVSRQSGWITPVVLAAGVVSGTWELRSQTVRVSWFAEAGPAPVTHLAAEVERISELLGRQLDLDVGVAG
jgi:Winged helix DNA-binding domain